MLGYEKIDNQSNKNVNKNTQSLLLNSTTITNGHSLVSLNNKFNGSPTKQSNENSSRYLLDLINFKCFKKPLILFI